MLPGFRHGTRIEQTELCAEARPPPSWTPPLLNGSTLQQPRFLALQQPCSFRRFNFPVLQQPHFLQSLF